MNESEIIVKKKNCSKCGTAFNCGNINEQPCWCNELPQIMPLSENEDCFCPDCLKIAIENKLYLTHTTTQKPKKHDTDLQKLPELRNASEKRRKRRRHEC